MLSTFLFEQKRRVFRFKLGNLASQVFNHRISGRFFLRYRFRGISCCLIRVDALARLASFVSIVVVGLVKKLASKIMHLSAQVSHLFVLRSASGRPDEIYLDWFTVLLLFNRNFVLLRLSTRLNTYMHFLHLIKQLFSRDRRCWFWCYSIIKTNSGICL